jgi:hypothetical protein
VARVQVLGDDGDTEIRELREPGRLLSQGAPQATRVLRDDDFELAATGGRKHALVARAPGRTSADGGVAKPGNDSESVSFRESVADAELILNGGLGLLVRAVPGVERCPGHHFPRTRRDSDGRTVPERQAARK